MHQEPPPPEDRTRERAALYGEGNLGSSSLFSGNFINFGYWTGVEPTQELTVEDRTRSQADMYRTVLGRLGVTHRDVVVEVGSGIGAGAALAIDEFGPARLCGLDISADQVERAQRENAAALRAHAGRLSFHQGSALDLPWPDASFTRLYSIEAAQHFEDLTTFAREAHRVLTPGGRLAVASFFTPDSSGPGRLAALIETVRTGIDVVAPVPSFTDDLAGAGFADARAEPIGERVWPFWDAWIAQTAHDEAPRFEWLRAYREGALDYYVVTATAGAGDGDR